MTDAADVPLICDPAPGGLLVVTSDKVLSMDQRLRLEAMVRRGMETGVLILDGGVRVEHIPPRAWPDAEYCAA